MERYKSDIVTKFGDAGSVHTYSIDSLYSIRRTFLFSPDINAKGWSENSPEFFLVWGLMEDGNVKNKGFEFFQGLTTYEYVVAMRARSIPQTINGCASEKKISEQKVYLHANA